MNRQDLKKKRNGKNWFKAAKELEAKAGSQFVLKKRLPKNRVVK